MPQNRGLLLQVDCAQELASVLPGWNWDDCRAVIMITTSQNNANEDKSWLHQACGVMTTSCQTSWQHLSNMRMMKTSLFMRKRSNLVTPRTNNSEPPDTTLSEFTLYWTRENVLNPELCWCLQKITFSQSENRQNSTINKISGDQYGSTWILSSV